MAGIDILGGLSPQQFLAEYWQKKPLLVRQAVPGADRLLEPKDLELLSEDDDIESRIVIERSPIDWELLHGPFNKKTYKNLPGGRWTLLVQAVDRVLPQFSSLLDQFNFIPNWRIDDIMASYAVHEGSVGPHFDNYDVFLIQGMGHRRWRIGQRCSENSALVPNSPLKILREFHTQQEWLLAPGDMLYLPPGLAHFGVAEQPCITYSVGFRAPSRIEVLSEFVHHLAQFASSNERYQDPDLQVSVNPGYLAPDVISRVQQIMLDAVSDREQITQWFAGYLSQPKYMEEPAPPNEDYDDSEVLDLLAQNFSVQREESSRFLYTGTPEMPTEFFINGSAIHCTAENHQLITYLCRQRHYRTDDLLSLCRTSQNLNLLTDLLNLGVVYLVDEEFN